MIRQDRWLFDRRWGENAGDAGFLMVPHALLINQSKLELTNAELVTLLNILAHWFNAYDYPFPSANAIAKRMGIDRRTVERNIKSLLDKGFLTKEKNSKGANCYNPKGIVDDLAGLYQPRSLRGR